MDRILAALPPSLPSFVERQLSSDEEMLEHLISNGLTEKQALTYHDLYLNNLYLDGFTPICEGTEALRFNPHTRQFEPK
ncbi:hypothetical protein [Pseudomonas fluorescens]|uniref:hypothetical protein n=1 Tax=Pseudomonas fluorescens TaxID=294 RepID=UPI001786C3E1|nr:hypothetical protein [Pseudomonas fluorescens]